uniref:NADH-ubiquinone oxidoreductase chain 2 n=1 Tax=Teslasena femoralis TaxID=1622175 RepID=A0A0H3UL20_9COLE|nr:NADH dehydrogenase subunit 2 [Teslasena femoralis]
MTKLYKILFLSSTAMGTLIAISSQSWLGMWMGLEINLLSIIPMLSTSKNVLTNESSMKYFIVQAIASSMIMISIIILIMKNFLQMTFNYSLSEMIMNSALLTKMGMAPFHFWFPEVMEGQKWGNCLLIMTWQKIAPMILIMYNMNFPLIIALIIMISMVISGLMGINQISLRKILTYSSINHMGWMMGTMLTFKTIWFMYFSIYTLTTIYIVLILKKLKIYFLNQLFQSMNIYPMMKMLFIFNFLSLSGIPPFLGFIPKWLTIQFMINSNMIMTPTIMIIFTLVTMYMYIRITLSSLLMNSNQIFWSLTSKLSVKNMNIGSINFFSISSMILITITFMFL